MTRKDYELLAATIRAEVQVWADQPYGHTRIRAIESLTARLANKLNEHNPRFDIGLFMASAGFPEEGTK